MDNNRPCYKCEERHVGCHSTCDLYLGWNKEHLERKAIIDKQKDKEADIRNAKIDAKQKEKRRHGRR